MFNFTKWIVNETYVEPALSGLPTIRDCDDSGL
jgi:hypothetical protein